jgi:hypothetical protein
MGAYTIGDFGTLSPLSRVGFKAVWVSRTWSIHRAHMREKTCTRIHHACTCTSCMHMHIMHAHAHAHEHTRMCMCIGMRIGMRVCVLV